MKKSTSLTIVIPAFNEQEAINSVVRDVAVFAEKNRWIKLETIIVDDGSFDKTFEVATKLIKKFPLLHLKVLQHKRNLGPGAALKTGNRAATSELVTYVPADGQFDVNELERFVREAQNQDLIIAYRTSRKSDSALRRILSQIFAYVVRIMFLVNVRDFNWVYVFRRKSFNNIKIKSKGFFILSEIIVKAFRNKLRIKEVPSKFYPRKLGKSGNLRPQGIMQAITEMFSIWFDLK